MRKWYTVREESYYNLVSEAKLWENGISKSEELVQKDPEVKNEEIKILLFTIRVT